MTKAERRHKLIADIAARNPNTESKCMAAYMQDVMPQVIAACAGTEWQGKENVIAMRACELA